MAKQSSLDDVGLELEGGDEPEEDGLEGGSNGSSNGSEGGAATPRSDLLESMIARKLAEAFNLTYLGLYFRVFFFN